MSEAKKIKNIKDLRNDLLQKYEATVTEDDKRDLVTFTTCVSAIVRSVKEELSYNKYKDNKRDIDFLEIGEEE